MSRQLHMFGWFGARCGVALVLLVAASVAQAQDLVWEDHTDTEGGWMDPETRLVWVDYSLLTGSSWKWPYARDHAASFVRAGHADWRLPTVAELQDASRKKITLNIPTMENYDPYFATDSGYWYWSSESTKKKGGQAWAVRLRNTIQQTQLWTQGFSTTVMFVRQAQSQ